MNDVRFVNLTPHPIVVRREDGSELTIPAAGKPFRLEEEDIETGLDIDGVPLVVRRFKFPEEIPAEFEDPDNIVIVSLPVLQVLKQMGLRFPALVVAPDTGKGAIRDESGKIIGTTRFILVQGADD